MPKRLVSRATHLSAKRATDSSSRSSSGRKAKTSASARSSSGHRAKSVASRAFGRKAKPAPVAPAASAASADPSFLARRLCLRCAKHAEKNPEDCCLFDKDSSIMCARCRAQKSPCLPVSLFILFLILVLIFCRSPPPWSARAVSCCAPSARSLGLFRSFGRKPFGAKSLGLRPSLGFLRADMPAKRPLRRVRKLWLRPTSITLNKSPPMWQLSAARCLRFGPLSRHSIRP